MIRLDQVARDGRNPIRDETISADLSASLRLQGLSVDSVTHGVSVGVASAELFEKIEAHFPNATQWLVLEAKPEDIPLLKKPLARLNIWVGDTFHEESSAYSRSGYFELCQFFLQTGLAPGRSLIIRDARGAALSNIGLERTVMDLCRGYSAHFLRTFESFDRGEDVIRVWSEFLFSVSETYHALKFYVALAALRPNDSDLALRIMQCWSELQCPTQMSHWLSLLKIEAQERANLEQEVASAITEYQGATELMFQRNLSFLHLYYPEAAKEIDSAHAQTDWHQWERDHAVVVCRDVPWEFKLNEECTQVERGVYPLMIRVREGHLSEMTPAPRTEEVFQTLNEASKTREKHLLVGSCLDLSVLMNGVHNEIRVLLPNWRQRAYLLERDSVGLAKLMCHVDFTEVFEPGRMQLFIGSSAVEQLEHFFKKGDAYGLPNILLRPPEEFPQVVESVNAERQSRMRTAQGKLHLLYGDEAPQRLAQSWGQRPLRVALLTSHYTTVVQYSTQDLANAFTALGHDAKVHKEQTAGEELHYHRLAEELAEFHPDCVVLIDHNRPEHGGIFPANLPVVNWIQDELPRLSEAAMIEKLGSLDLAFGFSTSVRDKYKDMGYPHVGHLPLAVDPDRFEGDVPDTAENNVVFITNLFENTNNQSWAPKLQAWFEEFFEQLDEIPVYMNFLDPHITRACAELKLKIHEGRRAEILYWVLQLARSADRVKVAESLASAGVPLHLYGKGWDRIPHLAEYARGFVQPGAPLRKVCRDNKVVLHIGTGVNLHPRVLEAYCSGAFVLGRHAPADDAPGETCDQFELGKELMLYRSTEELLALVERAFTDDVWRKEVVLRAKRRIRAEHTYVVRAETILNDLRMQLMKHVEQ
ncbi:MAG: glycosyltransferase [Myxococcota bacterium]